MWDLSLSFKLIRYALLKDEEGEHRCGIGSEEVEA